jgi:phosphatidylserine/phosphatidylglycerophosphate/cardiolipin synthase-like enzyme
MHALIVEARHEVLIVGYAVHQGRRLFGPLAERMRLIPDLRVVLCLNVARTWGDKTRADQLIARFLAEFYEKHWPWSERPVLRYDPRALSIETAQRASLHAKCVVIDRATALITSANLTEAAQQRNIEVGILVRNAALAGRLANYFEELFSLGVLRTLG